MRVPAAVYARYYFILRTIAVRLGLQRLAAEQVSFFVRVDVLTK